MFLIRNTHCQKGMWRVSARHSGVLSGVDFNVLGNPAELVSKFEFHTASIIIEDLNLQKKFHTVISGIE